MRPKPICPIRILLDGAFFPSTWEGIMVGATMAPAAVAALLFRNVLLFIICSLLKFFPVLFSCLRGDGTVKNNHPVFAVYILFLVPEPIPGGGWDRTQKTYSLFHYCCWGATFAWVRDVNGCRDDSGREFPTVPRAHLIPLQGLPNGHVLHLPTDQFFPSEVSTVALPGHHFSVPL